MASVAAANMEGVEEMSLEFNRRMHKLLVGSWYKLFKQMDDDGSGKITFDELLDMVRSELEFSPKDISDTALKRVWAALDNDRSGYLTSGEFGAFMRKGEAALRVLRPQSTWKEKLHSTRRPNPNPSSLTLTLPLTLTVATHPHPHPHPHPTHPHPSPGPNPNPNPNPNQAGGGGGDRGP